MYLYQTPGQRPQPITGRFVNTVTRGWVRAPNKCAPFRFHGAVVGFVDRCLSTTRNPAASNKHLAEFFSSRSWPKIGPGIIFFRVFENFETFFLKICAHIERYRNRLAGIFEILTFYGNIAFPLSPVLPNRNLHIRLGYNASATGTNYDLSQSPKRAQHRPFLRGTWTAYANKQRTTTAPGINK